MIKSRIQIGDGPIEDSQKAWGLVYLDADERTEAPIKKRVVTSYAEEAGEHTDCRTVADAFDYTAKFLIEAPNRNLENVNSKIAAFNRALYEQDDDSDIRRYKEITFYNDLNRVKITGLAEPIAVPEQVYHSRSRGALDFAVVELKIRVGDPRKCDFDVVLLTCIATEAGVLIATEDGRLIETEEEMSGV